MYDYRYVRRPVRRNRLFLVLMLLVAFALGVQVERRGWLPSSGHHEPPESARAPCSPRPARPTRSSSSAALRRASRSGTPAIR